MVDAAEGVVCFECYRASHARDETLDCLETLGGSRPKLQPQRTLTARAIQHRERMLEWIGRRGVAATSGRSWRGPPTTSPIGPTRPASRLLARFGAARTRSPGANLGQIARA